MYDYAKRFIEYGDSPEAVAWSAESQRRRFEELCCIGEMKNASILDLGCGLCHLFDFLIPRGIYSYHGVDRVPSCITAAGEREAPIPSGMHRPFFSCECQDILEYNAQENSVDYVMMSGVFNEGVLGEKEMILMAQRAFFWTRKGVAFNFLSTQTVCPDNSLHYYGPLNVYCECLAITRSVRMNCCYMAPSCDTSVFLYKEHT